MRGEAYAGRFSDRDAVDLWRLLEAAFAAGVSATDWPAGPPSTEAAGLLRLHFGRPGAGGLSRISAVPAHQTRIRALLDHVIGVGGGSEALRNR